MKVIKVVQKIVATVFSACVALTTVAAEYSLQPDVSVVARHEDNFRLSPNQEESLFGSHVIPTIKAQAKEQNWDASLNAKLDIARFNRDDLNNDDQEYGVNAQRTGELYSLGFSAQLVKDTTRTSEELNSGIFDTIDDHELYSSKVYGSYLLSETNVLSLSVSGSKSKYDAPTRTGYEHYYYGSAGWSHSYNEKLRFNVRANYSEVKYDPVVKDVSFQQYILFFGSYYPFGEADTITQQRQVTTTAEGYQVGVDYQLLEQLSFSILVGSRDTTTEYDVKGGETECAKVSVESLYFPTTNNFCNEQPDQNSSVQDWEVTSTWRGERNTLSAKYSNSLNPGGSEGYALESEQINLDWGYRLSEVSNLSLVLIYGKNTAIDAPEDIDETKTNRKFGNAELSYTHRVSRNWLGRVAGVYRYQEKEFWDEAAESSSILFSVIYQPNKIVWSR